MSSTIEGNAAGADERANASRSAESPAALVQAERELKLEGDAEALESAFASLAGGDNASAPARNLSSVYFDTPGGALWAEGTVLRVRKSQGRFLQTVKWRGPEFPTPDTRAELEVRCSGEQPVVELFGPDLAARLIELSGGDPFVPRFATQIRRRTIIVKRGESKIEVALDYGNIIDGKTKVPVREIELELKEGDAVDLYAFAEQLSAAYNLRLGVLTKSQRGYLLAADDAVAVRRAQSPNLDIDTRLDDLIGMAISECVDHFVLNWPVLLQSDNPVGIHQMRVAMRRLRSILKIFRREIAHPGFQNFRTEAGQIASALGTARDTDVFMAMLEDGPFKSCARSESIATFVNAAAERRDEGYGQAYAMLAAPQTTRFVLELRGFVARKGWREGLSAEHLILLGEPAIKFAARALERLDRKARKEGRHLAEASPEQRHELRIVLKNIRYCAEMFGPLFQGERSVRKYNRAAAELQEALGVYNDAAVADGVIADVERRGGAKTARAAGMVSGWTARGLADADGGLIDSFKIFKQQKRFWR